MGQTLHQIIPQGNNKLFAIFNPGPMVKSTFFFLLAIWSFVSSAPLKDVSLAYSSKATKIIDPNPTKSTQKTAHTYSNGISKVPEAIWIWAGYGNQADCPMNITIEDEFKLTCLERTITLTAAADNEFTATFFGQSYFGNNLLAPSSLTKDPQSEVCNSIQKFTITARNWVTAQVNCSGGNLAALIYGVTQKECCNQTNVYYNSSTCKCHSCSDKFTVGCLNCTTSSCTVCDSSINFVLNGTSCSCMDSYVMNNTVCDLCSGFLDNCTKCSSQTVCTECEVGYKLNPTTKKCEQCNVGCLVCDYSDCFVCDTSKDFLLSNLTCVCNSTSALDVDECKLCSSMMVNCTSCVNGTFCTSCQNRNMVNLLTHECELCSTGCSSCQFSAGCLACDLGYYLSSGICGGLCGDGILLVYDGEDCDDGNVLDGDGCNHNCQVEINFICTNVDKSLSRCSYSGGFRMFVKWVKKEYYENRINISIGVRPYSELLNLVDFVQVVNSNQSLEKGTYFYDGNGTLYLGYQFLYTLESQHTLLTFDFASHHPSFLLTPSSTLLVELIANSNIPITYYSQQQQYLPAEIIKICFQGSVYFSYALAIGSLVVNRVVSLELLFVWQVSHLSIGMVNKIQPILSGLFPLRMVGGYNWMEPRDNRKVPDRINAIQYSENISQNFNFNLVLLVLVSVLPTILSYIFSLNLEKGRTKLHKILKFITGQLSLYLVVFSSLNLGFSTGLQILYGETDAVNLLVLVAAISILGVSFILFHFSTLFNGQFYSLFKPQSESRLYIPLNIVYRFLLGLTASLLNQSPSVCIYSLFLSVGFLVYHLSVRPFKFGPQNYQSLICQISISVVLGTRVFYRSFKSNYPIQIISLILEPGYLEIVLLFVCIVSSLVILIKEAIVKYTKFKAQSNVNPRIKIKKSGHQEPEQEQIDQINHIDQIDQMEDVREFDLNESSEPSEWNQEKEGQIIETEVMGQESREEPDGQPNIEFQDMDTIVYVI